MKEIYFGSLQVKEMAQFIAELERQGIEYAVDSGAVDGWLVKITGC